MDTSASRYSDRICPPAETWARVEPVLQRFDITRLSRLTGLDRLGIPVWNAVSPNSKSIVINQGKGVSDLDARVSAAMEVLERAGVTSMSRAHGVRRLYSGLGFYRGFGERR